jgi:predicted RNA-binding protein Jag
MTDVVTHLDCLFSNETFDLLAKLTNEQTRNSSLDHEEEFKTYVMKPLQELRHQVSSQLPDQITKRMDMQNEMSLYPDPGNKRYEWRFYRKDSDLSINNNNAQLFIGISGSNLWFGFFISENSPDKQRFIQSYQNN